MNRRTLLRLLASGLVAHTLDVDKLLWVPGKKTIFLPPIIRGRALTLEMINKVQLQIATRNISTLFERDDEFYRRLMRHE